jgi:diacylglycerol kinase (ATP)
VKPSAPLRSGGRGESFRHAFAGWWHVLRSQPNAWIHAAASVAVAALGWWLGLSRTEWALILVAVVLVWLAEFLNTALEAVVDLASPQPHPLARIAKDVGAAAVLISAGAAAILGFIVLGPPLISRLFG